MNGNGNDGGIDAFEAYRIAVSALLGLGEPEYTTLGRELDIEAVKVGIVAPQSNDSGSIEATKGALRQLQARIGEANAAKGFHEHGNQVREDARRDWSEGSIQSLRDYRTSRVALIVTEAAELIEELRKGRQVGEVYYSGGLACTLELSDGIPCTRGCEMDESEPVDMLGNPRKPEGPLSELADVVIRSFDLAEEEGLDLVGMIFQKLAYNATRPHKHGKKF